MTVTKNTLIGDLLANDMNTARFLFEMGMHCVGCPASAMESLEDVYKRQGFSSSAKSPGFRSFESQKRHSINTLLLPPGPNAVNASPLAR